MCKEQGWTYEEYLDTPLWMIEIAKTYNNEKNKEDKRQSKKR